MRPIKIEIGQRFNKLTVIEELPISSNGRVLNCRCDCGVVKKALMSHVLRSLIKSCGCHRREMATKHSMAGSKEYSTWENMIQRCTNPKSRKYYLYGGRGITVCDRWLRSFKAFYEDVGPRPFNTTIDRINGEQGYYKENCKWSNPREQFVNVRFFSQCVKHDDVIKPTEEWIKDLNIDRNIFKSRLLRGFNLKEALFNNVDIITFNVNNGNSVIYHLHHFLQVTNFEKEKVLELLDQDHEEPYHGCIMRYLTGFNFKSENMLKTLTRSTRRKC